MPLSGVNAKLLLRFPPPEQPMTPNKGATVPAGYRDGQPRMRRKMRRRGDGRFFTLALQRRRYRGGGGRCVKDGNILLQKVMALPMRLLRAAGDTERTPSHRTVRIFPWTAVMQWSTGQKDLDADIKKYLDSKFPQRDGKSIAWQMS